MNEIVYALNVAKKYFVIVISDLDNIIEEPFLKRRVRFSFLDFIMVLKAIFINVLIYIIFKTFKNCF
jgi:hypothetical protein